MLERIANDVWTAESPLRFLGLDVEKHVGGRGLMTSGRSPVRVPWRHSQKGADPIVRAPDVVPDRLLLQVREQVVVVALTVHHVNRAPRARHRPFCCDSATRPPQGFASRISAQSPLVGPAEDRSFARPGLSGRDSDWIASKADGDARVEEEALPRRAGTKPTEPRTRATELECRRVVQDENILQRSATRRSHSLVRIQDALDGHRVVVEEPVQRLELTFLPHGFRKAACRIANERFADAF